MRIEVLVEEVGVKCPYCEVFFGVLLKYGLVGSLSRARSVDLKGLKSLPPLQQVECENCEKLFMIAARAHLEHEIQTYALAAGDGA